MLFFKLKLGQQRFVFVFVLSSFSGSGTVSHIYSSLVTGRSSFEEASSHRFTNVNLAVYIVMLKSRVTR
jgi:hypothetical protein